MWRRQDGIVTDSAPGCGRAHDAAPSIQHPVSSILHVSASECCVDGGCPIWYPSPGYDGSGIQTRPSTLQLSALAAFCAATVLLIPLQSLVWGGIAWAASAFLVFLFALTQGFMYEKSRGLLYVLLVHIIVDAFLVMAIMQYHYPGRPLQWFL
jgi:hypothetical protein